MTLSTEVLIVGAGPTGLAAALFLAERGYKPRLVERKKKPSALSKAFGVNARTLSLLEPTGVTTHFLENGRKLEQLNIRRRDKRVATLRLDEVDHRFPFLCVQSQADSERILADAVVERGIPIERGVEAVGLSQNKDEVVVTLRGDAGEEEVRAGIVFGADGAKSFVRDALGLAFEGESNDELWKLYDIELQTPLDPDQAHIFLLDDGAMFVVRHTNHIWRVLGTGADLLGSLPEGTKRGTVDWESDFAIANKVVASFSKGRVFLAGDAAHTHAGIGARGMNLGIEDAYVFALLYDQGRVHEFDRRRRPVVNRLVGQIKRAMAIPRAGTMPGTLVRKLPFLLTLAIPTVHDFAAAWVLGLDHDLGVS